MGDVWLDFDFAATLTSTTTIQQPTLRTFNNANSTRSQYLSCCTYEITSERLAAYWAQSKIPAEIVAHIASFARITNPAGRPFLVGEVRTKIAKGWVVMSHVCRRWRNGTIGHRLLWAEDVCAFPSEHAVTEFAARAYPLPLNMDLDRLMRNNGWKDKRRFFRWLSQHGQAIFRRAKTITCTYTLNHPHTMNLDYSASGAFGFYEWVAALTDL